MTRTVRVATEDDQVELEVTGEILAVSVTFLNTAEAGAEVVVEAPSRPPQKSTTERARLSRY